MECLARWKGTLYMLPGTAALGGQVHPRSSWFLYSFLCVTCPVPTVPDSALGTHRPASAFEAQTMFQGLFRTPSEPSVVSELSAVVSGGNSERDVPTVPALFPGTV